MALETAVPSHGDELKRWPALLCRCCVLRPVSIESHQVVHSYRAQLCRSVSQSVTGLLCVCYSVQVHVKEIKKLIRKIKEENIRLGEWNEMEEKNWTMKSLRGRTS